VPAVDNVTRDIVAASGLDGGPYERKRRLAPHHLGAGPARARCGVERRNRGLRPRSVGGSRSEDRAPPLGPCLSELLAKRRDDALAAAPDVPAADDQRFQSATNRTDPGAYSR